MTEAPKAERFRSKVNIFLRILELAFFLANVFPLVVKPKTPYIYHYDVEIASERIKKDEKRAFFLDFCKANRMIFKTAGRYGFAYDGEKNMYTIAKLDTPQKRFVSKVQNFFPIKLSSLIQF